MFLLLPLTFYVATLLYIKRQLWYLSWRTAALGAFLIVGISILASTEIFSIVNLLTRNVIIIFWSALIVLMMFLHATSQYPLKIKILKPNFSIIEMVIIACIAVIGGMTLWFAIVVPPNTWDAMTYHMPRVMHWIQNKSVVFYPTAIDRQLFINPFPEYWILHFQLLFGSDLFANSVQWLSMVGSALCVSCIAAYFKLNRIGQLLTVLLMITLPNAIVQASSTQTDFVATLWACITVYVALENFKKSHWYYTLAMALGAMLAVYTKGSTLFMLLPFFVVLQIYRRKFDWNSVIVLASMVIALGFFTLKNHTSLGSLVYPGEKGHILPLNDIRGIISNIILHVTMHLRSGITGMDAILSNTVETIHGWMGMSVVNSTANQLKLPLVFQTFPFFEDWIPNTLFAFSMIIVFVYWLCFKRALWRTHLGMFFIALLVGFTLLNAFVKWSPFDGRYHLPFFVLASIVLAATIGSSRRLIIAMVIACMLSTIPALAFNGSKPLTGDLAVYKVPRDVRMFYNHPGLMMITLFSRNALNTSGCRDIGLKIGEDTWEYSFWGFLGKDETYLRIEHVLVNNASGKLSYPLGAFNPCLIASYWKDPQLIFNGKPYTLKATVERVSFYVPAY